MGGGSINYHPLVPWLIGKARNVYTQFGEDGLIEATFETIGTTNRHCFEIGAADGLFYSNTLRLRESGWMAVLLEADANQFSKLQRDYGDTAVCIEGRVTDLDAELAKTGISQNPDFGVIDIDGQDYWMWLDLEEYRPRVMLVEIYPPDRKQPFPKRGANGG